MYGFELDPATIESEADATHLLLDAIRRQDQARQMMLRLWPKVSTLREALEPLEAEYSKWATQHYSCERRIGEIKKVILSPHQIKESTTPKLTPAMSDKQAEKYFHSLNAIEQAKLIGQLEALRKEA